jgi:thiamine biosynthesis lipoprotein
MAVATSGNYERFVMIDGTRYTHIIDPRTGHPVAGVAGVTVIGPSAAEADALSTALFVAGISETKRILAACPGCEAIFVPDRHPIEIWLTDGARALFEPLSPFAESLRAISDAADPTKPLAREGETL